MEKIISAIEAVFYGMEQKGLDETMIKDFSNVKNVTLPKDIIQTTNVAVKLLRERGQKYVVLACDNEKLTRIIFIGIGKEKVVKMLEDNNILPTAEEFLEARLLIDKTPSVASNDCKRETHHHLEMMK